ncbi:MAG: hypothetical protein ABL966_00445 [Acidimicrobiales bacterium]
MALAACSDGADARSAADDGGATSTTATAGEAPADGGTVDETVPTTPAVVRDPVAIDAVADFGDGVTARITDVEAAEAEAFMPGEVSGPAVRLTVALTNGTDAPLDLDLVTVELVDAAGQPATLVTPHEVTQLTGDLAPGATSDGSYLFTIAVADRSDVEVRVTYAAPNPTVVFQGSLDA